MPTMHEINGISSLQQISIAWDCIAGHNVQYCRNCHHFQTKTGCQYLLSFDFCIQAWEWRSGEKSQYKRYYMQFDKQGVCKWSIRCSKVWQEHILRVFIFVGSFFHRSSKNSIFSSLIAICSMRIQRICANSNGTAWFLACWNVNRHICSFRIELWMRFKYTFTRTFCICYPV